jgi:hypothetical protein
VRAGSAPSKGGGFARRFPQTLLARFGNFIAAFSRNCVGWGRRMDASEYRAKARELREMAKSTRGQEVRSHLLEIADEYDALAKALEADKRETEKS